MALHDLPIRNYGKCMLTLRYPLLRKMKQRSGSAKCLQLFSSSVFLCNYGSDIYPCMYFYFLYTVVVCVSNLQNYDTMISCHEIFNGI